MHSDDQVSRIIKYLYSNQDIKSIEEEINESNIYSLYAQAFALQCDKLLDDLRDLIVQKLLNDQSVLKLYLDALEHNDEKIMQACLEIIISNFDEIVRDPDSRHIEFLNLVNFDNLVDILSSDKLNITHEKVLVDIVREYVKVRDDIKPSDKTFKSAQDATPAAVWALLTDEERKTRQDNFDAKLKEAADKEAEAMEEDAKKYFDKEVQDRVQHVLDIFQAKENKKIHEYSIPRPLSDDQKRALYKTIRFSHLGQDDLLRLSSDESFQLAREFVVQGLACKLGKDEAIGADDVQINTKPRDAIVLGQKAHPEDYDISEIVDQE